MLFNSLEYWLFFPAVFLLYWSLGRRAQNVLILCASYFFYGWWDYRFLALIAGSSAIDFLVGRAIGRSSRTAARRRLLLVSLTVNLGALATFKYFDFFASSFAELLARLGLHAAPITLQLVLPVGISFYTFQTLSYTINIYRRQLEPTRSALEFFAFVSFFPQLVAGPIERAANLLPQFATTRRFDDSQARDGLRQILWGLTKKVVIADTLAGYVSFAYSDPHAATGASLALATLFFAFQIYCDFSGYSDIAIGSAKLLGFRLMRNFAYPYFATDIAAFWRRWHISLSTWFRDYVYIPLGGNRVSAGMYLRNVFATFVLSGLWHGANWTFIVWGALHGGFFLVHWLARTVLPRPSDREQTPLSQLWAWLVTFFGVLVAWTFFRAGSVNDAVYILGRIATDTAPLELLTQWRGGQLLVTVLVVVEWLQRRRDHAFDVRGLPLWARFSLYYLLCGLLFFKGNAGNAPFIYFQF